MAAFVLVSIEEPRYYSLSTSEVIMNCDVITASLDVKVADIKLYPVAVACTDYACVVSHVGIVVRKIG